MTPLTWTISLVWLCATAGGACVPTASGASTPGGRTVLLELFTSQGCSSCPAADAFVLDLPRLGFDRNKVLPLAFHVDYWNALGWTDPFSAPEFTTRQQRYADAGRLRAPDGEQGIRGPYTPQMVIDGATHFSGGQRRLALAAIERARAIPAAIDLATEVVLEPDHARVTVHVAASERAAVGQPWRLMVAVTMKAAHTRVTRGENRGEMLDEAAVVRGLSDPVHITLPQTNPVEITIARPVDLPWSALELAAFVQSETTLHIAAARAVK